MTRHRLRIPCLIAVAAVPLLAACGTDDDAAVPAPGARALQTAPAPAAGDGYDYAPGGKAASAPRLGAAAAAAAAPAAEATGTVEVEMAASQFAPAQITVARGQTVRWTNADPIAHTATATSGATFDSGTIEAGGEFSWKAAESGRVSYVCVFHPGMTGTIVVQ